MPIVLTDSSPRLVRCLRCRECGNSVVSDAGQETDTKRNDLQEQHSEEYGGGRECGQAGVDSQRLNDADYGGSADGERHRDFDWGEGAGNDAGPPE